MSDGVQNAIQVKEGRISRVPQTHMIMDGIWPPELVPLFLKDGGIFPPFVDADDSKTSVMGGGAGLSPWDLRSRFRKWSNQMGSFRRRASSLRSGVGVRRSVSAVSSSSMHTAPPEKAPPPPPMREGHHKLSVRFEVGLKHSNSIISMLY